MAKLSNLEKEALVKEILNKILTKNEEIIENDFNVIEFKEKFNEKVKEFIEFKKEYDELQSRIDHLEDKMESWKRENFLHFEQAIKPVEKFIEIEYIQTKFNRSTLTNVPKISLKKNNYLLQKEIEHKLVLQNLKGSIDVDKLIEDISNSFLIK